MTKEEILEKSRKENNGMDEYQKNIYLKSQTIANLFGIIFISLVSIITLECGGPRIVHNALMLVYWGMMGTESLYRAIHGKMKREWILGILALLCAVANGYSFFRQLF